MGAAAGAVVGVGARSTKGGSGTGAPGAIVRATFVTEASTGLSHGFGSTALIGTGTVLVSGDITTTSRVIASSTTPGRPGGGAGIRFGTTGVAAVIIWKRVSTKVAVARFCGAAGGGTARRFAAAAGESW